MTEEQAKLWIPEQFLNETKFVSQQYHVISPGHPLATPERKVSLRHWDRSVRHINVRQIHGKSSDGSCFYVKTTHLVFKRMHT